MYGLIPFSFPSLSIRQRREKGRVKLVIFGRRSIRVTLYIGINREGEGEFLQNWQRKPSSSLL